MLFFFLRICSCPNSFLFYRMNVCRIWHMAEELGFGTLHTSGCLPQPTPDPITCKLFPLGGLEQPFLHPESQDPIRTAIGCLCAGAQSPVQAGYAPGAGVWCGVAAAVLIQRTSPPPPAPSRSASKWWTAASPAPCSKRRGPGWDPAAVFRKAD